MLRGLKVHSEDTFDSFLSLLCVGAAGRLEQRLFKASVFDADGLP